MNKLRRKLLKFSILQFILIFFSTKSFSLNKDKKIIIHKEKKLNGFIWYLNKEDE